MTKSSSNSESNHQEEQYLTTASSSMKVRKTAAPSSSPAASGGGCLHRFALLLDGMTRASLLPIGPYLVHQLAYGSNSISSQNTWKNSVVVYLLASLLGAFALGRWLGDAVLAQKYVLKLQKVNNHSAALVARLGGVSLVLLYVTITAYKGGGGGLVASFPWLLVLRFVSAVLAGFLTGITRSMDHVPESTTARGEEEQETEILKRAPKVEEDEPSSKGWTSGSATTTTAKLYVLGIALSILCQFLLLNHQSPSIVSTASSQPHHAPHSFFSLVLFVGMALVMELFLRTVFSFCGASLDRHSSFISTNNNITPLLHKKNNNRVRSLGSSAPPYRDVEAAIEEESDHFIMATVNHSSSHNSNNNNSNYYFEMNSSHRSRRDPVDHHHNNNNNFPASVRSRMESYTSLDEFFDCRSVLSDMEDVVLLNEDHHHDSTPLVHQMKVARYINSRCVFEDGSSACVPPGESPCCIPSTYLEFYKGNHSRAQEAWEETQRWRLEKRVWKIHTLPNPWFAKIKQAYPHYAHGHSKAGFPIIYEQPGRMELKRLFSEGCSVDDMLYQYTFFMEFVANIICTRDEIRSKLGPNPPPHSSATWGIMVVMDVKGAGLSHLSGNVAMYVKKAGDINSAHYPTSMKRAFLVNAPFWLGGAWAGVKSILPDSVQVDILSERNYPSALREYIDEDQIPPEYGGTSPYRLGEHPYEVELRNLIESIDDTAAASTDDDCFDMNRGPPLVISTSASADSSEDGVHDQVPALLCDPLPLASTTSSSGMSMIPLRRRIHSVDRNQRTGGMDDRLWKGHRQFPPPQKAASEIHSLAFASIVYLSFNALQAALELFLPLWMLSPTNSGGLGFLPQRSCVLMFCSTFVLLWVSRRKSLAAVLQLPRKRPLRAFRISVGIESILLAALSFVSFKTPATERIDSVFLTTSIILVFAGVAFASALGRAAAESLHFSSAADFARRPKHTGTPSCCYYGWQNFLADCESGRLTSVVSPITETIGAFLAAPLLCWSFSSDLLAPFCGAAVLLLGSLLALLLYLMVSSSSSSLYAKKVVPSSPHGRCACGYRSLSRSSCLPFIGEAVSVSTGDLASLMEEGHWSSTPILGRSSLSSSRGRAFSDSTSSMVLFGSENVNSVMERGGGAAQQQQPKSQGTPSPSLLYHGHKAN